MPYPHPEHPLAHLELRTANAARACTFFSELFGWRIESVRVGEGSYLAVELSGAVDGGIAEREEGASWLPYVEVDDIAAMTGKACDLGAQVTLNPREGPAGWRSVLRVPAGAEVALWQPKT
jgi:uncharacterized protein